MKPPSKSIRRIGFQSDDDPDRFHDLVATNLSGTYHTFRAAIPHLRSRKGAGSDEDEADGAEFVRAEFVRAWGPSSPDRGRFDRWRCPRRPHRGRPA